MNEYEKYKIQSTQNMQTIYFWLKNNGFSEHQIKLLRKNPKSFKVNGSFCNIKQKLEIGDTLEILTNPQKASEVPLCDGEVEILYEDDEHLIVNKPHLLACIPTRSHISDNLGGRICNYMKTRQENFVLRIVNRLDKDTAGIVVVAKDIKSYNNLKSLDKTYYALCEGTFEQKSFTIDKPILTISTNGINEMRRVISDKGKQAITHATVLKEFQNYSLLKVKLETGRTHQIRVHLSSEGHPLLGDSLYSENTSQKSHTFLLLKEVSFFHYKTGKKISIEVPFPNDWYEYIK